MSNIYDFQTSYSLVKRYVIFAFKRFYGEYIVTGRENIPKEGPVIFAANHLNALMDALAVISVLPHKMPIVYLGRADLFKNKTFASILEFSKILPAFRMRDGAENLEKNHGIFECCVDVLDHNHVLGIMPEGNQGPYRRLRPLVKGIFRIAFTAQQKYGTLPGVKIVPIGIDMGDFEKYGEHIIINVGKPIEVSDFMAEYTENPVNATNLIRDRLHDDLSKLTFDLASEKYYESFETATEVANTTADIRQNKQNKFYTRFIARQETAKRLITLENEEPEKAEKLEALCREYKENLNILNLESKAFGEKPFNMVAMAFNILILLCTIPVFMVGALFNFLPFFSPDVIRKALKIEFPGGIGSLRFGIGLITFPFFYLLQGILICLEIKGLWWYFIFLIPLQYYFGILAFQWYQHLKRLEVKFHFRSLEKEKSSVLERTKLIYAQINQIV